MNKNIFSTPTQKRSLAFAALIAAAGLALGGCATATDNADKSPAATSSAKETMADALTVEDGWVKSVAAGEDMTGAFGALNNSSDKEITVVSASSPSAGMVELHEVAAGADGSNVMQEKKDGFVIPAKDHLHLVPGENHIMLMSLTGALAPGDTVTVTLTMKDGSTVSAALPVKEFTGANESYDPHAAQ